MKIYTKTGDDGRTGLLAGGRLPKYAPRIDAYGTVDELNAAIGVARAHDPEPGIDTLLGRIQNELFTVGSALADPDPQGRFHRAVTPEMVARLEHEMDAFDEELPRLVKFILPGGTPAAAQLHLARTVCRRAERLVVELHDHPEESVTESTLIYLNRLSDWLFLLARLANLRAGRVDTLWEGL